MSSPKDVYVALASIPVYTSAQFELSNVIHVTSSTRDHIRNTKRSSTKTLVVPSTNGAVVTTSSQDVSPEVVASAISPSGNLAAILRESGQSEKKRFVEIWAKDTLIAATEVTKLHGVFYTDEHLRSLSFSPSETKLVYTAEANTPESQEDPYARFRFLPDFGESLTERKRPHLVLFQWEPGSTESLGQGSGKADFISFPSHLQIPPAVLFGQAIFATEDCIFATGYEYTDDGHLLGIKGCWNRPSSVWELQLQLSAESPSETDAPTSPVSVLLSSKISDPARSARSPRVFRDPDSTKITVFWLSNQLGGPHASCSSLHSLDLDTRESKTLLATIDKPAPSIMDNFAGLYTKFALPAKPFLRVGKRPRTFIVTQTAEGSRTTIVLINAESPSDVKKVTSEKTDSAEDALWSWNFLGTDDHAQFLCARSSPTRPNELLLGTVDDHLTVNWKVLDAPVLPSAVGQALKSLQASIIQIADRHPVETILVKESKGSRTGIKPLATSIHGGPHDNSFTSFTPSVAALALQGYNVSLPNYTGSLGFGEYYVQKLLGKCGSLDVEDTVASVQHLIKLGIAEDKPEKLFILGGSHGGFLATHLVGQYPDKFGAAVVRNPVTTGASPASTDIPDWYFWEFGIPYKPGADITPELYEKLWKMSPIAHVDKVRAPVLLHLGTTDRRVVNVQGKDYYHALKGRGKTVEIMEFKGECHPLDGVEAARVAWESTVDWFEKVRC